MKRIIIILILNAIQLNTFAQNISKKDSIKKEEEDTIIIRYRKNKKSDFTINFNKNKNDTAKIKHIDRIDTEWLIDIGFNNFVEKGNFPSSNSQHHLRNAVKYFAITWLKQIHIGNEKSPVFFNTGLELSWNGFMFTKDVRMSTSDTLTHASLTDKDPNGGLLHLRKSKLGVAYLSIPIMFTLDFNDAHQGKFKLGLGGYAGLRLKSWNKLKYDDGKKEKSVNSFFLNDFRYGLMAEVGFSDISLFIKYDLNPLFQTGRGFNPNEDINAINIGIRL